MYNLIQKLNEQIALRKLRSAKGVPTFEELKQFLENRLGAERVKKRRRSIFVVMPWFDLPEKVEDMANDVLRRNGIEYSELTPGKPDSEGKTNKFQIFGPILNMGNGQVGELGQDLKDQTKSFLKTRPVRADDRRRKFAT